MSQTHSAPAAMWRRAASTAWWAERLGRKPKLHSEKPGSKTGVSTCTNACWISRSSAVGTPSSRDPTEAFGIVTLRTGCGRKVPASSAALSSDRWRCGHGLSSSVRIPSMPGAPAFCSTRLSALAKVPVGEEPLPQIARPGGVRRGLARRRGAAARCAGTLGLYPRRSRASPWRGWLRSSLLPRARTSFASGSRSAIHDALSRRYYGLW
jgi:hypothetical protein